MVPVGVVAADPAVRGVTGAGDDAIGDELADGAEQVRAVAADAALHVAGGASGVGRDETGDAVPEVFVAGECGGARSSGRADAALARVTVCGLALAMYLD